MCRDICAACLCLLKYLGAFGSIDTNSLEKFWRLWNLSSRLLQQAALLSSVLPVVRVMKTSMEWLPSLVLLHMLHARPD